ncbi:MAG: carboxy- processing protease, partial [Clostridia bacterium]|nr:carboxy- processing protease [Clostridia bacterium]
RRNVDKTRVTSELIDGEIGYIRVSQFTTTSPEQFTEKLATLKNIGAKSYIIDMRNNPGGQLYAMYKMLDELMPEGEVFIERDKAGNENRLSVDNVYYDEPVIVLVNEYSISAAEYFAAVMQERGRAVIVGTPTTGKGMAQQTFELSDGSSVSFSVIKYYTPNGVNIGEAGGIQPDMAVEMTYDQIVAIGSVDYQDDPQIVAAVGYMKEYLNR